jgi:signal transduction histidine kinase
MAQAIENALLYGQARDAIQLRERFLSIASHELRTPLAALLLQTRVLEQAVNGGKLAVPDPPREELVRRLRGAVKQVERLGSLVSSLFDLARIRSGRFVLERGACDLSALAREVAERFEDQLSRQGRPLRIEAPEPVVGSWDRSRIDQALTNLVANAVKHGVSGAVGIRIERRGPAALLVVQDSGAGIPEQDRARIFELFEQGERGTAGGGLGLGLYITRRIAEAHGGRIWVDGAPEGGAVFQVELPLAVADAGEAPEPAAAAPVEQPRQLAQG